MRVPKRIYRRRCVIAWGHMPKSRSATEAEGKKALESTPAASSGVSANVAEPSPERTKRLAALRSAVLRGEYRISSEQLASKLIKDMRRD